ncbi:major facilitator superfamily domain-containing protein 4A-like [Haliotis rubra]|uniref:major facilitator superfamily domain-containing protein 4A-like n=1 Tax=Haliotis rubra TaxID=36100 RepID=UPI001EE5D016|nr:major facilitator superfamily domain-containing protein 4A-like [Haliotis rubra]
MSHSTSSQNLESSKCAYMELALLLALSGLDGLIDSCFGPSLHDLQCLYCVSVQTISTLFPLYAGFKTAGSVLYMPLYAVFNVYTLMMTCVLVSSCLVIVIPLCPSFWLAAAASSGLGLTGGVVNSARVAKIGEFGQEKATPFHLMGIAMCTGNILGPLIISPFLTNTTCQSEAINITSDFVMTPIELRSSESNIAYAYVSFASFGALLVVFLAVLRYHLRKSSNKDSHQKNKYTFGKLNNVFVSLQIFIIFIGGAANFVYGTQLLLFGTRSNLKISKTIMSLMTSSFYAVTLLGRVVGVLVSLAVSQACLVTSCLVGSLVGSVFLVFTAEKSVEFLWAGSHFLGLFYAPLFAALLAWCGENVTLNHTLYVIVILFDLAGTSLIALIIGQMMCDIEPHMLHYSMVTIVVIQIMVFLCLFVIAKWIRKKTEGEHTSLTAAGSG